MFKIAKLNKVNEKVNDVVTLNNAQEFLMFFENLGVQKVNNKEDVELLIFSDLGEKGGRTKKNFVSTRFLTLDVDSTTTEIITVALDKLKDYAYVAHETFSSTTDQPRWRIVVPLAEYLTLEQKAFASRLAEFLNIPEIDRVSNNFLQPYYLPSCPLDEERQVILNDGNLFSIDLLPDSEVTITKVSNKSATEQELLEEMRYIKNGIFNGNLIYTNEIFYFYNGSIWVRERPEMFIKRLLIEIYKEEKSLFEVKQIVNGLKYYVLEDTFPTFEGGKNALVLQNQTVIPEDGSVHEHDPSFYSKYALPFEYNPKATCDKWLEFLESVFKGDEDKKKKILLLQEFMGLSLSNIIRFQKMMVLVGNGSNGKSVVLDIVRELVGVDNASAVPMKDFGKQFSTYNLLDKLVNIDADMPMDHFFVDDKIKPIVSGDSVFIEKKGKQGFDVVMYSSLWCATNDMPKTKDHSHGFHRRLLVVTFNRKFSAAEQDHNLVTKLKEELAGIFVWALDGLKRLLENDQFTIPESSVELLEEYQKSSNAVAKFAEEHIKVIDLASRKRTNTKDVYLVYKRYCTTFNYYPLNESGFGRRLKTTLGISRIKSNGKTYYPVELVNIDDLKTMADTAFQLRTVTTVDVDDIF